MPDQREGNIRNIPSRALTLSFSAFNDSTGWTMLIRPGFAQSAEASLSKQAKRSCLTE
jgi:hypothetical protein